MSSTVTSWSPDTNTKASETTSTALNNATLSGTLAVEGATALSSTLTVTGATVLSSTLTVSGTTTLGATSFGDNNITNVGSIGVDTIYGDLDSNTGITFEGSDVIKLMCNSIAQVSINDGSILPVANNDIDLGSGSYQFKDAFFDGTITTDGLTVSSTTNLDGAVQVDNTITVGVSGTGYDVKFFGTTAGKYMLWDEDQDDLVLVARNATLDNSGNLTTAGYIVEGRTVIKIPPTAFISNDDAFDLQYAVLEDDSSVYGVRVGNANSELYAYIDVPLGYTATKVRINGSDDDMEVEVYTLDLDAGTISSEISNSGLETNDDTALASNHVGADDKMLFIKVITTAVTDIVWGGYVTIAAT